MFNNFKKYKNNVAIDGENLKQYTYGSLLSESNKLKKKISSKSICLLICSNSFESILGYISFLNNKKTITILLDNSIFENKYN